MKFCPDCGTIIQPSKEDGKTILNCSKCDYTNQDGEQVSLSEKGKKKEEVHVVEDDDSDQTKPIIDQDCPECDNDKAYYWTIQTRAGDEAATRFYKCTECKHTWREY